MTNQNIMLVDLAGAADMAHPDVIRACRLVYAHDYLVDPTLSSAVRRAWNRADVGEIAQHLSSVCAALYELPGGYDRWRACRDALFAIAN